MGIIFLYDQIKVSTFLVPMIFTGTKRPQRQMARVKGTIKWFDLVLHRELFRTAASCVNSKGHTYVISTFTNKPMLRKCQIGPQARSFLSAPTFLSHNPSLSHPKKPSCATHSIGLDVLNIIPTIF